jgi:hypothetical protein
MIQYVLTCALCLRTHAGPTSRELAGLALAVRSRCIHCGGPLVILTTAAETE